VEELKSEHEHTADALEIDEDTGLYPDEVVLNVPPPKNIRTVRVRLIPSGSIAPRVNCDEYLPSEAD
jgi:hypothetical protein